MKQHLLHLPLAKLVPPTKAIRQDIDPDAIADLADSLRTLGQLQPILVKRDGNRYRIIAGHRRFLAAEKAELLTLTALETDGLQATELMYMVAENCARQDLTPWEEAQVIHDLVDVQGSDVDHVARAFGKTRTWVDKRRELYFWPEDIRQAVHRGLITLGAATELAHVEDPGYRDFLVKSAISGGCSTTTARLWRTEWEGRGSPAMAAPTGEDQRPVYLPPPAAGLACSTCGVLTALTDLQTLHICGKCLKGREETTQ